MNRRLLFLIVLFGVLLPAILVVLLFARPATPKIVDLYAGPEGSTYYEYAEKYAEFLSAKGITVRIQESSGSIANLRSLAQNDAPAAAFALSGVDERLQDLAGIEHLESLGCLSLQPFWMFVRAGSELTSTQDLAGQKVALGRPETDARAIAILALSANGVIDKVVRSEVGTPTPEDLAQALVNGDLDAAFLVGRPDSPGIGTLLKTDGVEALSFRRTDAYTRLHPEVGQVVIPEGLYDLAANIPDSNLHLIAPADNLVVRSDLHPALVDLFLDAAKAIHREPTLFGDRGTFPNMRHTSLPLNRAAVRFYEQGPPTWRKYLPYWLATLVSRFALIVAQVGAVVLLILKGIPTLLRVRFKVESNSIYKRMEVVERDLIAGPDWDHTVASVRDIQNDVSALKVPKLVLTDYLELRQSVHDLRERLEAWHEGHPDPE